MKKPFDYEAGQVRCPHCGNEQADMGNNVACEECGEGPMPTRDVAIRRPAKTQRRTA